MERISCLAEWFSLEEEVVGTDILSTLFYLPGDLGRVSYALPGVSV